MALVMVDYVFDCEPWEFFLLALVAKHSYYCSYIVVLCLIYSGVQTKLVLETHELARAFD